MRILLIMAMLMGVLSAPLASAASDQNGALVAVGDSITSGYYLGSDDQRPSEDAFPYLVGKDEGWGVIDLGVPGWKSGDLLNALESSKFQQSLQDSDTVL